MVKDMVHPRQSRKSIILISTSPSETRRLGVWLGRHLKPGDVVCLWGEMGSGKTLLTRGIAKGLGVPEGQRVRSPTFTLVHEYMGRHPIYHLDLYRLRGEEELEGIGWEEYLYGNGVTIIEAAEKMDCRLPQERLDVMLGREGVRRRRLILVGYGRRFGPLVNALAMRRPR
ncbi:MAG: tRNA (adenosine(37)-N6)-threonylcarbamoyltransferase complex ATPase subunit type 1 TsaE [Candidatus Methylomirabilales bacterium]